MALLEVVRYCVGWAFWSPMLKLHPVYHNLLLLPLDQDVELSTPSPAPCLSACHHEDNTLNL